MMDTVRPCMVNGKKALFHMWAEKSQIVPSSPMVGGHNGGIVKGVIGIVEYEDGQVDECYPHQIRFIDDKLAEYCFTLI